MCTSTGARAALWACMQVVMMQLLVSACSGNFSGREHPSAVKGVLDLRHWDFTGNGPVNLSGEWKFYWNRLLTGDEITHRRPLGGYIMVPGIWNGRIENGRVIAGAGCATYLLRIMLPPRGATAGALALKLRDIGTAYMLFIDGVRIGASGTVSEAPETAVPGYWPDVIDVAPEGNTMDVMVQVSNYHHRKGGLWEPIMLGTGVALREMREKNIASDFFLFGSIFLMGLYHLVLFALRNKDRSYICFGIFCMLIALRVLVTGEYYAVRLFPSIPWEGILAMEYITFYAAVPVFFMFMQTLFPGELSERVRTAAVAAGIAFCTIVAAAPPAIYTRTLQAYQGVSVIFCLHGLYAIIRALIRRHEGAVPFFMGFIVLFIAVLNDYLHNNMVIQTGYLVPCGLVLFIVSQAFLLSLRFSRTVSAVEHLTGELESKNRKLMDLDEMKDDFLATVSHELKTPLHGIIGIAESMIDGRCGKLSLESKFNLALITASGRRLSGLVDDIHDFSRLKNCDMKLSLGPVDMRSLVDVVFAFIRPLIGARHLALINSINPGGPLACGDEHRVQQILYNLVGNAVKHSSASRVVVASRMIEDTGEVEVSVTDSGGPAPEVQFYETGVAGGCDGIGLSISRKLAELHGGSFRAESNPGGGSAFLFTLPVWNGGDTNARDEASALPAVLPADEARQNDHTGYGPQRSGRILVVDDDIINIQLMRNNLFADGFNVDSAVNGDEALGRLARDRYDLVLLDLMMPGISGLQLCGEIRKRFSLIEMPVIILTARHGIAGLVAGFECGANDYLLKPIHRDELLARVRTLVTLKKTVQEHHEAQFKLLQERMSPHFLFNSLNTIHALINKDRAMADRAVIMLADNYRFLIDYSFLTLIPFDVEWRFVENYLALEELRFSDFLSVRMERSGDFSSLRVPPLILQPLVENALKHGIRQRGGSGTVGVFAQTDGRTIRIAVHDNGVGLKHGDLFTRSLGNIHKRLKYYYADVVFAVDNAEGGGVTVGITFSCECGTTAVQKGAAV